MHACTRSNKKKNGRELCIALWYKKISKYNGNGFKRYNSWLTADSSSNEVFHTTTKYSKQWLIY